MNETGLREKIAQDIEDYRDRGFTGVIGKLPAINDPDQELQMLSLANVINTMLTNAATIARGYKKESE